MALTVKIDWNKDADFSDTGEDVTSRTMANPGIAVQYGRDQSTALAPMVAGGGGFTLNNASGDYTPLNSGSPIFGDIKPARPVEIKRTVGVNTYTLFAGHTDDTPLNPDLSNRTVQISLVDYLADFRNQTISTALYEGKFTGEIIDIILDEVGWDASLRDLDQGATVFPFWWEDGTDALDALEKVIRAEGPPALLTIGADGSIVFKDRHHRLLDTASISSQDTWYGATTEPVISAPLLYDDGWRNIINHGLVTVDVRTVRASEAIWTLDAPIRLGNSEVKTFIASASDPFKNATTPTSGTDYDLIAGSLSSVALSRTSGASTTITLTAGGGGAQLTGLQLRAQPVQTAYTVQVTASDATSITDYGQRSFPGDLPLTNIYDAQAVLETAIEHRAQPLTIVHCPFVVATNSTRADAILARDLSDRVTIEVTAASLNNDFFVESISHDLGTELDHTVTVGCELAPTTVVDASDIFILDNGNAGHDLDSGLLAP